MRAVIRQATTQQWLIFEQPQTLITAWELGQVQACLEVVAAGVQAGLYGVGWLSYEASPAFDSALVTHAAPADFPLVQFGLYGEPKRQTQLPPPQPYRVGPWLANVTPAEYARAIAQIKAWIAAGDTYQVNYSYRQQTSFGGDPWGLFWDLMQPAPAPYGAYLETPELAICSASPELFFEQVGDQVTLRPMKGTVARGLTPTDDDRQATWLQTSPKNRAENLMIVDMIRNDVGRVATVGSVQVPQLFAVERYPTVQQMTSTVTAQTPVPLPALLAALFPCASITGAPKARTMQMIRDLEPTPRRLYTGTIGLITPTQSQFSVAIRTVIVDRVKGEAEYGVGGGIVWDSDTASEAAECHLKGQILQSRPAFSLLETLRWTPAAGYFLYPLHWARLRASAAYFGILVQEAAITEALGAIATSLPPYPHKVRLLVDAQGQPTVTASVLPPPPTRLLRLAIAQEPIDPQQVFLYHKTTQRQPYDHHRARHPEADDVLLWNPQGELTEACNGNLVLQQAGHLYTPPVTAGLLGGTFRQHLLQQGHLQERTLTLADLGRSEALYLINSVRQWQPAYCEASPAVSRVLPPNFQPAQGPIQASPELQPLP